MKLGYFSLLGFLGCLALACTKSEIPENRQYEPKFAVEGSIPLNGFATVNLTHNLPIDVPIDSAQLEEIIIRWAKVEVFSGEDHEVLTLVKTDRLFPFYHYVGRRLRGHAGRTYMLRITYADQIMEAETTIPPRPKINEVTFKHVDDSLRLLQLNFTDLPESKDFYRFYGRLKGESHYASFTPGGIADDLASGQTVNFQLFRNKTTNMGPEVGMYYKAGDTVQVKLSNMPEHAFKFWKDMALLAGQLPSLGSPVRIQGNVEGPAVGIWYGEAYDQRTIIVK